SVQRSLTTQGRQNSVGAFCIDYFFNDVGGNRLDVGGIGHFWVSHDRGRVGVHQHYADTFVFEDANSLRARVVKFGGLTDHDRSRSDTEYGGQICALWHDLSFPSSYSPVAIRVAKRSKTGCGSFTVMAESSGEYCTVMAGSSLASKASPELSLRLYWVTVTLL